MMKKVLLILLLLSLATFVCAQSAPVFDLTSYGVRIEPDKRLIAVLATLEVAGMEYELSDKGEELRIRLRETAKKAGPDLKQKIDIFVNQYKKRHSDQRPSEIAAPFISMAYSLSPAPQLDEPFRSIDLPDDLLEVLDFSVLVREFYKAEGVSQEIDRIFEEYKAMSDELRPSAREMVTDVLDYMNTRPELTYIERVKVETQKGKKTITTYEPRARERSFTIVPELLTAEGTVNFLNITDDYYAIIPPDTDLSRSEVRRGYLQFVLDPLVLNSASEVREKSEAIRKLINDRREAGGQVSADPYLTITRSLVAAVDAREEQYRKEQVATAQARSKLPLLKTEAEKQAVVAELNRVKGLLADEAALQLSESYEEGAILNFYFAEKLQGIEESGFDIASSLKDWIISLDATAESGRLTAVADARKRAEEERARQGTTFVIETTLVENPLTNKLLEIDKIADAGKYPEAEQALKNLLEEAPTESPRIYYALGRLSSRSAEGVKDSEELNLKLVKAKVYYENVLRSANETTDPGLLSSTYFALGRIYEFYKQPEYAEKIYDAALRIGKVEGGAFDQAFEAKKLLLEKKNPER
ncbi:MAG: hypothetical protein DWQ47_08445 [Acidobacteria bacterium]|nr:MAG: hypothetical protein DWQ32_16545 [Acidobacteriota bacterium]REJ99061.1 MAG: hypothetical protein DWQ38_13435 [Acidobacteriota bacterium]REK16219.1 MAG: hypothetical protein DWQ43_04255 [Acidobacteriota bacterium]REK43900.1 MAG: hypothetical protein DWQ47_08445 [Acidobacteriota bacterium]